jgi:hypothetical protein
MSNELRDTFRKAVFERDGYSCVVCGKDAVDAHHLYERKLWPGTDEGGYILDNGVSLCESCHQEAERTDLGVELLAEMAGIKRVPLPPLLEKGERHDKWGNVILSDYKRVAGPLFFDTGVQKALANRLHEFTPYVKFPRTPHLPWSPGATEDDLKWQSQYSFILPHEEVVITEKMDGENTTIYRDFMHARSIETSYHPSRTWVKNFAAQWQHELPVGWRVCGENVYATHSIKYTNLQTYFYGFSIWERQRCLNWDTTLEWFSLLGIVPAPVLVRGTWKEAQNHQNLRAMTEREGYVVRPTDGFSHQEYRQRVAKYVRANHVTTDSHWLQGKVDKNELA